MLPLVKFSQHMPRPKILVNHRASGGDLCHDILVEVNMSQIGLFPINLSLFWVYFQPTHCTTAFAEFSIASSISP